MNMKHLPTYPNPPKAQRGAILVVSILLLFVLTIVSISSITTTVMQEKTTNNAFNTQLAFQSSEAGLRLAEDFFRNLRSRPLARSTCSVDCNIIWSTNTLGTTYGGGQYANNWWSAGNAITNESWWSSMTHQMPELEAPNGRLSRDTLSDVAAQPGYIAEELAFIPDDLNPQTRALGIGLNFYRITSRGTGGEAARQGVNPSQIYLQSIFGKRFN